MEKASGSHPMRRSQVRGDAVTRGPLPATPIQPPNEGADESGSSQPRVLGATRCFLALQSTYASALRTLSWCAESSMVETIGEHRSAAAERAVQAAREANGEALHRT